MQDADVVGGGGGRSVEMLQVMDEAARATGPTSRMHPHLSHPFVPTYLSYTRTLTPDDY
jgi:hypothetical protein